MSDSTDSRIKQRTQINEQQSLAVPNIKKKVTLRKKLLEQKKKYKNKPCYA